MWTRKELKERAKSVLRGNYWKAFLISLVILMATGSGSGGSSRWNSKSSSHSLFTSNSFFDNPLGIILFLMFLITLILIAICIRIFLGYPLEVGGRRYFVQSAQYIDNKRCFKFAFSGSNYIKIVLTMLLKGVWNFLWYLLFVIPGIIKYYSYIMVPYILADNPNIGYRKAIDLSKKMTDGYKWNIFVLDLSFIGWCLLGFLALIIGTLFVLPYVNATKAELYLVLRQNALDKGMCSHEDLQLFPA